MTTIEMQPVAGVWQANAPNDHQSVLFAQTCRHAQRAWTMDNAAMQARCICRFCGEVARLPYEALKTGERYGFSVSDMLDAALYARR